MSRALDKHTIAALKAGNPRAAYDAISSVLVSLPPDGLLEIEILGKEVPLPSGTYVLQDGLAVGVSKLGLVQAFPVARKMLKNYIGGTGETGSTMATEGPSVTERSSIIEETSQTGGTSEIGDALETEENPIMDHQLLAATAVILLMDPEFLTAANTRKRLVQKHIALNQQRVEDIRSVLGNEKRFLDSLLTSRLHRHTKSPTLWNHRRWVVETFASTLGSYPEDITADVTNIVFVAGERHPRNYYAWCHARIILKLATQGAGNHDHISKLIEAVKKWCFRNHTDISGWSFLLHLLDRYCGGNKMAASSTFREVLDMAMALNLTNESVWVFLRIMAASGIVGEGANEQFTSTGQQLLQKVSTTEQQHSTDERVLRQALDWYETFGVRKDV